MIVVACASDEHYIRPLAAMLRSTIDNLTAGRSIVFYILQAGISNDARTAVTAGWPDNATARWIEIDPATFDGLPLWGRMPVSTYFKLGLPDLLPENVEKVLWLDSDVIVLDDVAELWDQSLEGARLAAVADSVVPFAGSAWGISHHRELGIDPRARYFNAGVMLIDVAGWRRDGIAAKAFDYLHRFGESVTFWDQEGLNAALAEQWVALDERWNHNASLPRKKSRGQELPAIVHFAGRLKPWRYQSGDDLRSLYYVYLDKTSFAGWRPEPSASADAVAFYEHSGLRRLCYPVEGLAMRVVRGLSRRVSHG